MRAHARIHLARLLSNKLAFKFRESSTVTSFSSLKHLHFHSFQSISAHQFSQYPEKTRLLPIDMKSWSCPQCNFKNDIQDETCKPCAKSQLKCWACDKCTFINGAENLSCEICSSDRPEPSGISWRPELAHSDFNVRQMEEVKVIPSYSKPSTSRGEGKLKKQTEPPSSSLGVRKRPAEDFALRSESLSKIPRVVVDLDPEEVPTSSDRTSQDNGYSSINKLLASCHGERKKRANNLAKPSASDPVEASSAKQEPSQAPASLSILTYNVWFREDLEVEKRMTAIGGIIESNNPDIICLQEVTPLIYKIFQQSGWWKRYKCSVSMAEASTHPYFAMQLSRLEVKQWHRHGFSNSAMGRELTYLRLSSVMYSELVVATSHLESPCPSPPSWNQHFSSERIQQAKESFAVLSSGNNNVVFMGDMNWNEKNDGLPPLPLGWLDAWQSLRPNEAGLTYDCKANNMLEGGRLYLRLDRAFCKLRDFVVESIDMVGTEAIPGVSYTKARKVKGKNVEKELPVFPSDHFGVLLRLKRK